MTHTYRSNISNRMSSRLQGCVQGYSLRPWREMRSWRGMRPATDIKTRRRGTQSNCFIFGTIPPCSYSARGRGPQFGPLSLFSAEHSDVFPKSQSLGNHRILPILHRVIESFEHLMIELGWSAAKNRERRIERTIAWILIS